MDHVTVGVASGGKSLLTDEPVRIYYTDWLGKCSWRRVVPRRVYLGTHRGYGPNPVYLLDAYDLDAKVMRTFAMGGVNRWVDETTYLRSLKDSNALLEGGETC